jgi:AraC family transcriptional regulator, regulatory protein of adaptative response / methylated-DNA-[protein]-cysteine methyltransferase
MVQTDLSPSSRVTAMDETRWAAVMEKNARFDGSFVYAVTTTGVYCRPSCPARPAKRMNVRFHATCADAEAAGFRACKRCRPNGASRGEAYSTKVIDACRLIETLEEEPSLQALAQAVGLSPSHFHRIFKSIAGVTPKAYAIAHRRKRVREHLPHSETVTAAIYSAGFNSNGRFYATSSEDLGMTPSNFRDGGRDAKIKFAVGPCSLGEVLIAASHKGICAVLFGDDADALVRDLQNRFPKAEIIGSDAEFERIAAAVIALVEAPGADLHLPLDVRGTAFQHRVWQVLRETRAGTRTSYADIARRIGRPSAVRAVARACAANNLAVLIPCHRVVRRDGGLSGYRWGVERKRELLDREAKLGKSVA